MSKPKSEIRSRHYVKEVDNFFAALGENAFDIKKLEKLLADLLTESEMRMIKRRWYVANLINAGRTVRQAAEIAGVGTDTVVRVVKKIRGGSGVLKEILLEKMKSEDQRTNKIIKKEKKPRTIKWFFGVK